MPPADGMPQTSGDRESVSYYGEEANARGADGSRRQLDPSISPRSSSATWHSQSQLSQKMPSTGRLAPKAEYGQDIQKTRRKHGDDLSSRRPTSSLSFDSQESIMEMQLPQLPVVQKDNDLSFLLATLEELRHGLAENIRGNLTTWFRREFRSYTAEMLQLQKELSKDLKRDVAMQTSRIGQKLVIDLEEALTHHFRSQDVDKSVLDQARLNKCKEVAEASSLQVIGDFKEALVDDVTQAVRQEFSGILAKKLESNAQLVVQELKDWTAKLPRPSRSSKQSKKASMLSVSESAELTESSSAKSLETETIISAPFSGNQNVKNNVMTIPCAVENQGKKTASAPLGIEDVTGPLFECPTVVDSKSSMGFLDRQAQKKAQREEEKEQEPWWAIFIKSDRFEQITAMVVITSTIFLGVQTNAQAAYPNDGESTVFKVIDVLFAIFFTVEVVIRIVVHEINGFFWGPGRKWNRFDFTIVVFTNVDLFLRLSIRGTDFYTALESLGFLRLMRLGKLLRVLRMVGLIPELKMMVYLISASFHSFIWALILMMLMIFVVSVYFTEVVAKMVRDDILAQDEVSPMWGTIGSSVLSLFQAISGGDDWSVFMEPLGADPTFMGSTNIMFFSFYVAFMIFVTMNLVTGVFVEGAQRLISEDKDAEFLKKTQALFGISDTDGNLEISYSEFQELIAADEINEYFISCDFNRNAASGLFQLLDADQSGSLSLDEFVGGCLRLRSVARCVDLVNLCIVISEGERVRDRQFCKLSLEQTAMRREIMRIAEMLEAICEAAGTVVPPPCQTVSEPSGAQVHGCVSRGTWLMDRKL
eukprot:TRINITY_DN16151_c0_g2_i1.p1 TRINITY_DN16151_c0_g2~~TRINITY_DN16151_c0_g2_i1.p1  ORF type:complete len:817 (-),score=141.86 TRINITY_DN16151_c0_g2_i1:13-2463(-)